MPETLSPDIRFSWLALADAKTSLTKGPEYFCAYTETIGADTQEMAPFWWATFQLMRMTPQEINSLSRPIQSGHQIFRPHKTKAQLKNVVLGLPDDLYPDQKYGYYNLGLVGVEMAGRVLHKLETEVRGFSVVTYDPAESGLDYDSFENPLYETHPSGFTNYNGAEQLVTQQIPTCWDSLHTLQPASPGYYPFGNTMDKVLQSFETILYAGIMKEFHLRAGFTDTDDFIDHEDCIPSIKDQSDRDTWLATMIRMIKEHDSNIPIVIEIPLKDLSQYEIDDPTEFYTDAVAYLRQI